MLFACVRFLLLLEIFVAATHCEDTKITFSFQSHADELGDDVQYEVQVFSSHEDECNYHDHLAKEVLFNVSSDVETHSMMITKPHITQFYCVRITPVKRNRERCQLCHKYAHEQIISVSRVSRGLGGPVCDESCKHWNLTYFLTPFPNKDRGKMIIDISSTEAYHCSEKFDVHLYSVNVNAIECNDVDAVRYSTRVREITSHVNASFVFEDLKPGNYCITIYPRHQCCDIAGRCEARHTKIVYLSEDVTVLPLTRSMAPVETSWITVTLTVAAVFLSLMCAAVFIIRFRRAQPLPMNPDYIVVSPPELEPKKQAKVIKVLCPIEAQEIQDCVKALVDFLCVNYQLNVQVDFLDTAKVFINPVAWYSQGDVFLVVETEGAAFRHECLVQNKIVVHKDENPLDYHYIYAVNCHITDPNSLFNYAKFVVVHFSFTPYDIKFTNIAMDKRYFITQHLHRLCYFLTYGEELKFSIECNKKFNSDFKENAQFLALNNAIDCAAEFVRRYPNYVRDNLIFE